MNGTPRLRSSYPSTPESGQRRQEPTQPNQDISRSKSPLPNLPDATPASISATTPVIPVNLIDAPSQRMYTFAVYGLLLVWRLYDWWKLVEDDTHSMGLFLKWGFIDLVFLFGVPLLRIPWLEWSETTTASACLLHVIINGMLMFRIPVSLVCLILCFF
jgi:nucleoporin POM152